MVPFDADPFGRNPIYFHIFVMHVAAPYQQVSQIVFGSSLFLNIFIFHQRVHPFDGFHQILIVSLFIYHRISLPSLLSYF